MHYNILVLAYSAPADRKNHKKSRPGASYISTYIKNHIMYLNKVIECIFPLYFKNTTFIIFIILIYIKYRTRFVLKKIFINFKNLDDFQKIT